jgi:hypothetical protein
MQLKGIRIQLGVIDDIKSKTAKGNNIIQEIERTIRQVETEIEIIRGLKDTVQNYRRFGSDLFDDVTKFENQSKELGIQPPKEVEDGKKVYRQINEVTKRLIQVVSQVR